MASHTHQGSILPTAPYILLDLGAVCGTDRIQFPSAHAPTPDFKASHTSRGSRNQTKGENKMDNPDSKRYRDEFKRRTLMDQLARIFGKDLSRIYFKAEIISTVAVFLTLVVEWTSERILHITPFSAILAGFITGIVLTTYSAHHGGRKQRNTWLQYSSDKMVLVGYLYARNGRLVTVQDIAVAALFGLTGTEDKNAVTSFICAGFGVLIA